MLVAPVGMGLWTWLVGWDHAVLWIEGALIALFANFWLIQTQELWREGLREYTPEAKDPPTPSS